MRLAVVTFTSRRVGGVETYLDSILPGLLQTGMEVSFLHEIDQPKSRPAITMPAGVTTWNVAQLGADQAIAGLRAWQPDLIFSHGVDDPDLEARTLDVAPAVMFIHNYYGTCIGGQKTFRVPDTRPCARRFGPACLLLYFPRRCGGLSPITMARLYRSQGRRLQLLPRYRGLLTNSEHMRQEYIKHGIAPERVHNLTYLTDIKPEQLEAQGTETNGTVPFDPVGKGLDLLFMGRMERLKGGHVLLDALPLMSDRLQTTVRLTMAGDGRMRAVWQQRAGRISQRHPRVRVDFPGWLSKAALDELCQTATLLMVPSLWPEPFGLVGVEAGRLGVPAAGFNVGGIPEWLKDGINGHLAPGVPPTAAGLAEAVTRCVRDREHYAALRRGAREIAEQFNLRRHLEELVGVLRSELPCGKIGG